MKEIRFRAAAVAAAVTVAAGAIPFSASAEEEARFFVMMNIPYSDFYSAEVSGNDVNIDAVSSATDAKWKKFETTYFEDNADGVGGTIKGVSFPVAVRGEDYAALSAVSDSAADYYYTELTETPAVYKELDITDNGYSFSEVKSSNVQSIPVDAYSLTSSTPWGDYLFEFADQNIIDGSVYGIVVTTDDGTEYGMRHLENIWLKTYEFSWSSGIVTTEPHGNTLDPEHYRSIMGKTISTVEYITTTGVYDYVVNQYVPVKTGSEVSAADADVTSGKTDVTITPALPSDYEAVYTVDGLNVSYADGALSFNTDAAGSYTLTVSDSNGKYAPISASFILSTNDNATAYDDASKSLYSTGNDAVSAGFIKNITSVSVDGTEFAATGKRGVKIIDAETGAVDTSVENADGAIFAGKDSFDVVVKSAGYPDLAFTLTLGAEPASDSDNASTDVNSDSDTAAVVSDTDKKDSDKAASDSDKKKDSDSDKKTSDSDKKSSDSDKKSSDSDKSSTVTSPKTSGQSNAILLIAAAFTALMAAAVAYRKTEKD